MKKFLLTSLVAATLAASVPAAFGANVRNRITVAPSNYHADENRSTVKQVSRRQLQSGAWSYRAMTRRNFTHPKSFVTDTASSSSVSSSSASK